MNLHSIVSPLVSAVSPNTLVQIQYGEGNTTNADGSVTPSYAEPVAVYAQIQATSAGDLHHIDMLNLQGSHRIMYVAEDSRGIARPSLRNGDLVTLPDGSVWLVTQPMENWFMPNGWVKCILTLQNNS